MEHVLGPGLQQGHVVRDIEAAMARWASVLGVGPFFHIPRVRLDEAWYRGGMIAFDLAVAVAFRGDTMIELIQPLDDTPTPFSDHLAAGREGLQHLGFWPDDQDAAARHLHAQGLTLDYWVRPPGSERPSSFHHDPRNPGQMIELIEGGAAKRASYAPVRAAEGRWRNGDPAWVPWTR